MIDITFVSGLIKCKATQTTKLSSSSTENAGIKGSPTAAIESDHTTLSTLARQLNDSAARAELRDTSHTFKSLRDQAKNIIDKIAGQSYYANRKLNDSEMPDTDDAALIARARQATQFAKGTGKNPFAGLSQDHLRLIMYDESGCYTINERSAAFSENYAKEEAWNRAIAKRYVDEYNETGKSTETLVMILAHYNELPPIEKAQYPANYAANLTADDSSAMAIFSRLETRLSGSRA